eukprot:CAMPEP_0179427482 /NCGR_PEP_ID=MMETSP0799-20121207/13417_1 /TAXON_ID=46947 /ORGANISM="Geminigera cryophila, Strain CCMP2564" /LENGTH=482 /DNA_ID=CAMNT_0021202547 /DNA_START=278 /DNA_END=1726 /DNA_ORIENTATION=+
MAIACGESFTAMVSRQGDLWAFGRGDRGQLGLSNDADELLPALVGGADEVFDGKAVVMVAAGHRHAACVTAKGMLWSWGKGAHGQLGQGERELRQRPARICKEVYGGSPAVMVACGAEHTVVLTAVGCLWSCGWGFFGQLGHGDTADKLVMTLVGEEGFRGAQIVMVAAGGYHNVALGAEGGVWTWGAGDSGQLGHNNQETRLVPTLLAGEALGGSAVVLVAAGGMHTVALTIEGELWTWGWGLYGQLGLGDEVTRLAPTLVEVEAAFGGSQVLMAACGDAHTLAVTKDGALWTFGEGRNGALGHNDHTNRLMPKRIKAQHFGNASIVSAAAGQSHSAAVTGVGALYTWGEAVALGHASGETKFVPTLVATQQLQGVRVGRCHDLPPMHALAFAMGTHVRLSSAAPIAETAGGASQGRLQRQQGKASATADEGKDCEYATMPGELVQRVVEACGSWPEGRSGELDGVVRLLGGGMMKPRGST